MATMKQKAIMCYLSQDGSIVSMGRGKFAVRDGNRVTMLHCDYNSIYRIRYFLKKKQFKNSWCWQLNKSEVLKLRKNHTFKAIYLEQRKNFKQWQKE